MEKHRGYSKAISRLRGEDGTLVVDPQKILEEERLFYQKLYRRNPPANWHYRQKDSNGPCLTDDDAKYFEQEYSDQELANALMGMANAKTPGKDGLSADFYKVFWIKIGTVYGLWPSY